MSTVDVEQFQNYLRQRLRETGVSMRQLSLAMGRDPTYVAQLLEKPPRRSIPTPDELRLAAPILQVPLIELLEQAWGIDRRELVQELETIAAHRGVGQDFSDLTTSEWEEILEFVAFVRALREMRRARQ